MLFCSPPSSPFPPFSLKKKKGTCILTLIKGEKREKHQEAGSEALSARLSPTCGHGRRRCACYLHQTAVFPAHQPSHMKTINYGSNEGSSLIQRSFPSRRQSSREGKHEGQDVRRVTGSFMKSVTLTGNCDVIAPRPLNSALYFFSSLLFFTCVLLSLSLSSFLLPLTPSL